MGSRFAGGRRRRQVALAAALLAPVGILLGCGGEADPAAAAPADCLESWNAESASQTFGRHAYEEHGARRAQAAMIEPGARSPNVRSEETCAVVFPVPENDPEFGEVGLVVTRFGWASMGELDRGGSERLEQIQRDAGASANVTLFPDGRIEPG
jgi:hypothetical protein